MLSRAEAEELLAAHQQQHVLRWFDDLGADRQQRLLSQLAALDLDWLRRVWTAPKSTAPDKVEPYEGVVRLDDPRRDEAIARGEGALRGGKVCCLLVAGGQGTRLGFAGPKGDFPVGVVSGRTLFQLHVERLLAIGKRYGVLPPLYLMTSPANHDATCEIFARNDNYGYPAARLSIFPQGVAPAVDEQGKLLMKAPDALVLSPNGNGGLFAAMRDCGALAQMEAAGIDNICYVQVDNALSATCDPLFLGYHLLADAQYSCKAIPKCDAYEKVGNFALIDGRLGIVEYTEIPEKLATARNGRGELLFGWGNPGLFIWSRQFAAQQASREDLPYHRAHKKVSHLDAGGQLVKPQTPNAYKLESFALDTLVDAERTAVVACVRDAEFAPVKNAAGTDSADSARQLMTKLYRSWLAAAGADVQNAGQIEISALYALDADELARRLPRDTLIDGDCFLTDSP